MRTNDHRSDLARQSESLDKQARITAIARFLDQHREDFDQDPEDDSFFVHRHIIEAVRKMCPRHCSPFEAISSQFYPLVVMGDVPSQVEFFPGNVPAIKRFVFIKGDGICLLNLHPVIAW